MASAHKCDRCGSFYETNQKHKFNGKSSNVIDGIRFTFVNGCESVQIDLCDDCIGLLDIFLKMKGDSV